MKTKLFILGLLLSALTTFGQWNPTPFMRNYGNTRTNASDARIGISALGTNDAVPLGFTGALTVTTNAGVVIAAIAITPSTLNLRPGNGLATLGDGTNVANNRLEIYDTATRNVLIQSAGISFLNGGNVGIATNNPQQALHVTGTIRATAFEDQNGNPISGGGGGGDVKTNANNTYTSNSTNTFSALTTFSNVVVVASNTLFYASNYFDSKVTVNNKFTANGTMNFAGGAANVILATDINKDISPVFIGNGINWTNQIISFSGTNSDWATPDDYIAVADSNGKMTNRTPVTLLFVAPGFSIGTVGTTNYVTNTFTPPTVTNYVFVSPGLTTTVSGTTVTVSNSAAGGGGSQTPWLTDIDAAGNFLTNVPLVEIRAAVSPVFLLRSLNTNDFSMDVRYSVRTNIGLPAAVATIQPRGTNAVDTRDFRMALDLFTKGNPTDRSGVGVVWSDWCSTNEAGVAAGNFESARVGKFSSGPAYLSAAAGGSGVVQPLLLNHYGGTVVIGSTNKAAVVPNTAALSVTSTGNVMVANFDDGTGAFALNAFADGHWNMYDWSSGAYDPTLSSSNGMLGALGGRITIWGSGVHAIAPALYFRSPTTNTYDQDVRWSVNTNNFLAAAVATLQPATTNLNQRMAFQILPRGTPTDNALAGVSWLDIASTNETQIAAGPSESVRLGKFSSGNGYLSMFTNGFADGTLRNLLLNHRGGTVVIGSTNKQAAFPATSALIVESTGTTLALGYNDGTASVAFNPQSDGSMKIFDYGSGSATHVLSLSNGFAFFNKALIQTNGFFIKSNAISAWPTTPRTAGDSYFGNSNGFVYALCSGTGNTWTKTNLIASP